MNKSQGYMADEIAFIAKQVLLALSYMHGKNLSHRNVKADNVLVSGIDPLLGPRVKLAGFGFAAGETC